MNFRAAVALAAGDALEIGEVDLERPITGEVLVKFKATGACHTDAFTFSVGDPEGAFPVIQRHEGAGIVVEGRSWRGAAFGGARERTNILKITDRYMDDEIDIGPLITHTMPFENIKQAFDLMHAAKSIRSVVIY